MTLDDVIKENDGSQEEQDENTDKAEPEKQETEAGQDTDTRCV